MVDKLSSLYTSYYGSPSLQESPKRHYDTVISTDPSIRVLGALALVIISQNQSNCNQLVFVSL